MPKPIPRRTVLRGLGTTLALPWLEAMAPLIDPAKARAAGIDPRPRRMAFLYVPNGVHMPEWTPKQEGRGYELPEILKPLAPFRDDLLVLTGLAQDNANAKGDGGGDHARALAAFLTGVHPRKTDGANIRAGISVDQVAAQKIGHLTRFPSLELGCDPSAQAGNCDSGYSCAYSSNISWSSETTPLAKEVNPRLVFDRLFGEAGGDVGSASARRRKRRQSVLDYVSEDARRLRDRLGTTDRRKLDEYLTSVREIERRLVAASRPPVDAPPNASRPAGIPDQYGEHIRLMCDMIALAFQTDLTRIVTFVLANEGSNRTYNWLGVADGHHELSHHGRDPEKQSKIQKINTFHVEQLAYLLGKLKEAADGEGQSVLDNCMIVYGSGIADGDAHNHNDLPILLAGRGAGTIQTGRHVRYPDQTPLNNLFLAMLDRMDARVDALGDSTGTLPGLDG
ncbi:MAG: hypothetical protein KatS3mg108_3797 [Isosphaeraceae bacterium]|jgi:hypothetical protein|nr:MAG: hypothetical protein KatS3mg108_3797 [Isosphaeraceae bacterium]